MAPEIQKFIKPGFFGAPVTQSVVPSNQGKKPVFVDVGGGFNAIAVGIIDNFLIYPRRMSGPLLKTLLDCHFGYFPEHRTTMPGLVTATERMQYLIKRVGMRELVQSMAYSLRQMAVDELCAHPNLYHSAFVWHNVQISPEELRKYTTQMDANSIAALAKMLNMPIEVQVIERLKTLPMRLRYNHLTDTGIPPVVIRLLDGHYTPRVMSSERFISLQSLPIRTLKPVVDAMVDDRSLSDIFAIITADNAHKLGVFENIHRRLVAMVVAGELGKKHLLDVYVKGVAPSINLEAVTVVHGSQDFLIGVHRGALFASEKITSVESHDQALVEELVHALARAISIGEMSENAVFSHIDQLQETQAGHALRG